MVIPWTFVLLVIILVRFESIELPGEHDSIIGYQIQGASFGAVNDVYICADKAGTISSVCTGIFNRLVISSAYVMVNDTAQKRWFIASKDDKNGSGSMYLYGAIELSSTPWLLKTWKRIGGDWDHGLTVSPIHLLSCQAMANKNSMKTTEIVTSATTVFWIMLSYSSASSLFTTAYRDKDIKSARFATPIGRCVFVFHQYLKPRVVNDDEHTESNPQSNTPESNPRPNSQSNNRETFASNDVLGDKEGAGVMLAAEIAHCDWLAFVGSSLSTVRRTL